MISLLLMLGFAAQDPVVTMPDVVTAGPAITVSAQPTEADRASAVALGKPDRSASFLAAVRERLDILLNDYTSARFRDVRIGVRDGNPVLCGWVNAKNAAGGYVGWQSILVISRSSRLEVIMDEPTSYKHGFFCSTATAWAPSDRSSGLLFR